jgi:PAS domain S-box-containing protein
MLQIIQRWKAAFRYFQVSPEPLAMYSVKEYKCVYANIHFCKMTGYDLNELLTLPLQSFLYPDDIDKTIEEYDHVNENQKEIWSNNKHVRVFNNRWVHGKKLTPINMTWQTFDNQDIYICRVNIS